MFFNFKNEKECLECKKYFTALYCMFWFGILIFLKYMRSFFLKKLPLAVIDLMNFEK